MSRQRNFSNFKYNPVKTSLQDVRTDVQVKQSSACVEVNPPLLSPQRLHISNIPFRFREHHLAMLFSNFGEVLDATVIFNYMGSKGFGFVTMAKGQDAAEALKMLNNSVVDGRIIQVNLATPKCTNRILKLQGDLMKAEMRLAKARVEVKRVREEMNANSSGGGGPV